MGVAICYIRLLLEGVEMGDRALYRSASLALALGAFFTVLFVAFSSQSTDIREITNDSLFYLKTIGSVVAGMLLMFGVMAAYVRQREGSGILGLLGTLLIVAAVVMLIVGANLTQLLTFPLLASLPLDPAQLQNGPSSFFWLYLTASAAICLGGFLFGLATVLARVYNLYIGWVMLVAGPLSFAVRWVMLAAELLNFPVWFLNSPVIWGNLGLGLFMLALFLYAVGLSDLADEEVEGSDSVSGATTTS